MSDDRTVVRTQHGGLTIAPGTRLNGIFEIERQVGSGGMGMVYRGRNIETGDAVAIKIVRAEMADNPQVLALFRKEAAVLHKLLHDAIVRYYLFTTDPGINRPYLATEFVDGIPLSDLIEKGPLARADVLALAERLADGLKAAHKLEIYHRDISPDNVILPAGDVRQAKIIDFGIARAATLGGGTVIGDSIAGKFDYMAPEQLGLYNKAVDARSDIYTLGIVLAEALLGRRLDMSGSQLEVIEKRRRVPDLSRIEPKLRAVLAAMLQPRPDDRIQSMDAVAAAMRKLTQGTVMPSEIRRAGRKWVAAAVVLGMLGAGGAALTLGRRDKVPLDAPPPFIVANQDATLEPPTESHASTTSVEDSRSATSSGATTVPEMRQADGDSGGPSVLTGTPRATVDALATKGSMATGDVVAVKDALPTRDASATKGASATGDALATGDANAATGPSDGGSLVGPGDRAGGADRPAAGTQDLAAPTVATLAPPVVPPAPPIAPPVLPVAPTVQPGAPPVDNRLGDGSGPELNRGQVTVPDQSGARVEIAGVGSTTRDPVPPPELSTGPQHDAAAPTNRDAVPPPEAIVVPPDTVTVLPVNPIQPPTGSTVPGSDRTDTGTAGEASRVPPVDDLRIIDEGSALNPAGQPGDGVLRYVRQYDAGPCTLIRPLRVGPGTAVVAAFGTSLDQFRSFDADFRESNKFDAQISISVVSAEQCPVLDFLSAVGTPGDGTLRMQIDTATVPSGGLLSGAITGLAQRDMLVFIVGNDGRLYGLNDMVSRQSDDATLHTTINGHNGAAQPHLVVAIAGKDVPYLTSGQPEAVAPALTRLRTELAGKEPVETAVGYFMFGG